MANTSVHLPNDLERLDREAIKRGISRNRLIVHACERAVAPDSASWPIEYFSEKRFSRRELRELHGGFDRWMHEMTASRRSRRERPF
jgi:hypothetical protein